MGVGTSFSEYCAAKGYQITAAVKEITSWVNDAHPRFLALLRDPTITLIVVEHKDRAIRSGLRDLETLLKMQGRHFEVVKLQAEEGSATPGESTLSPDKERSWGPVEKARKKTWGISRA